MTYRVLFDANVLYPSWLRTVLIGLAQTDIVRARWTEQIHQEWIEAAIQKNSQLNRERLVRTAHLMNAAVRDCLVTGYEPLIEALVLPDADDRHVLAAGITAGVNAIVTFNTKDFPDEALSTFNIQAVHPDDFLIHQIDLSQSTVLRVIHERRIAFQKPPVSAEEFISGLSKLGLPQTGKRLGTMQALI